MLFCQSGSWKQVVVGGGGMCADATMNYIHASAPVQPGEVVQASGAYTVFEAGWYAIVTTYPAIKSPQQLRIQSA